MTVLVGGSYTAEAAPGVAIDADRVQIFPSLDSRISMSVFRGDTGTDYFPVFRFNSGTGRASQAAQAQAVAKLVRPFIGWPLWIRTIPNAAVRAGGWGASGFYVLTDLYSLEQDGSTNEVGLAVSDYTLENGQEIFTKGPLTVDGWPRTETIRDVYVVTNPGNKDSDGVFQRGANTVLTYPGQQPGEGRGIQTGVINVTSHAMQGAGAGGGKRRQRFSSGTLFDVDIPANTQLEVITGIVDGIDITVAQSSVWTLDIPLDLPGGSYGDWLPISSEQIDDVSWSVALQRTVGL